MIKRFSLSLSVALLALFSCLTAFAQEGVQTLAKQAIVIDYQTGAVLYEKNADERMPTSSMSKVLTMYEVFKAIEQGSLSLDSELMVSERAWKMEGSKMFVAVNSKVKVDDLAHGVIVQSGNDAAVTLAEGVAGSEAAFANRMNDTARELGMANSHFMNASGWPDPEHYSTARDLSILAKALISHFPEYYAYYSQKDFTYNNIKQGNRNPLLYQNIGADGIKTGHTEAAGYGLIGSGIIDGRRVIFVVNGLPDQESRAQESARLLEWGLRNFTNKTLFKAGDTVDKVAVVLGEQKEVPAVVDQDLLVTLPVSGLQGIKASVKFKTPVQAPVTKGQELGTLELNVPGQKPQQLKLYAGADVAQLGFFNLIVAKLKLLVLGSEG